MPPSAEARPSGPPAVDSKHTEVEELSEVDGCVSDQDAASLVGTSLKSLTPAGDAQNTTTPSLEAMAESKKSQIPPAGAVIELNSRNEASKESSEQPSEVTSPPTQPMDDLSLSSKRAASSIPSLTVYTNADPTSSPPPPPLKDNTYIDPTPKTPQGPLSPIRTPTFAHKDLPDVPRDVQTIDKGEDRAGVAGEGRKSEDSQSEIQSIMEQFADETTSLGKEEIMSPRLELAARPPFPPRKSSLEPLVPADSTDDSQPGARQHRSSILSNSSRRSLSPPAVPPKSPPKTPHKASGAEPIDATAMHVTGPPPPEPEPDQPFDFHRFLEQLRHRTADPVAKFLRSFLTEFGKRQWMVHEQVKIISDFLAFITNKMAICDVWKEVSDIEFDNAKEGMEKLVMNRLYSQTFSPAIPPPPPLGRIRSRSRRKELEKQQGPGRRGQHQEDVERDEILAQKIRIYSWVREEHLDIPSIRPNGHRFLVLAQQELLKIKGYRAPRDKVVCILNCCKVIFGLLKNSKDNDTSADSFMPLLIYVVLKANPEHLVSNLQYILRFRNQEKLGGEAGYYLSSLSGAIQFIETLDRTSLTVSQEEFDRNVEEAVSAIAEKNKETESLLDSVTEKSSGSRDMTPRNSEEQGSRSTDSHYASNSEDNPAMAGLLRTIQKPLTTIGRIFSDEPDPQRRTGTTPPQQNVALSATPYQQHPTCTSERRSGERQRSQPEAATPLPPPSRFEAQEAAARQASAEAAEAHRIQRAEHSVVVETLSGMFPNLDKDIINDVVRMKEGSFFAAAVAAAINLPSQPATPSPDGHDGDDEEIAGQPGQQRDAWRELRAARGRDAQEARPEPAAIAVAAGADYLPQQVRGGLPGRVMSDGLLLTGGAPRRHWRYISSFHGPWLQLPPDILETLSFSNYASPRPHPIDPGVFFDLVKIRRAIEEATDLAVRASNGTTSSALGNSLHAANGLFGSGSNTVLGLGIGGGTASGHAKLSRERRHRMREHASQKLAKAYRLDEIAASVATMQSASALEEVAKLVLQRNEADCDAKYVHFFHEKIPSRSLAACTTLGPLDEIIAARPREGSTFRTRAVTRLFKEDFAGAAKDLTEGLSVYRLYMAAHRDGKEGAESPKETKPTLDIRDELRISEKDQPTGLEAQILFHRAGVYLSIASQHVKSALDDFQLSQSERVPGPEAEQEGESAPSLSAAGKAAYNRWLEARKIVKTNARRALRDYMTFLSRFDYTPGLSSEVAEAFLRKVNYTSSGNFGKPRRPRNQSGGNALEPGNEDHGSAASPPTTIVYKVSELFASQPPQDLPPFPAESQEIVPASQSSHANEERSSHEAVTYHPLLTDALHSVLLCHALVQTSSKELLRHAYMVARIARVSDGYPIFLGPRSPSRADWMEAIYHAKDWIDLPQSWESLCAPTPLSQSGDSLDLSMEEERETRKQEAILEALGDDRVFDEATFRAAVQAREKKAEEQQQKRPRKLSGQQSASSMIKRWAQDDGREYPICTERAEGIVRWVQEAPLSTGEGRAKGKKGRKKKASKTESGPVGDAEAREDHAEQPITPIEEGSHDGD
ncbi:hypothetical protein LOZ54_005656 [Ophidiomyces ophidiicola]|nr:hypothetical protein LOZ54_005656 [Ophidiomyces ophidiicola]